MGEAQDKTDLQQPYYRLGLPKQGLPEDKFPGGFCKSAVTAQFYYQMEQNKKKKRFYKKWKYIHFFFCFLLRNFVNIHFSFARITLKIIKA